jgi:hypothetical protein
VVEFGDEHRGHAVEGGAAVFGDGLQGGERVEPLAGEDDGGTMRHAGERADHHAEAMIHRHRDADEVAVGVVHHFANEEAVVEDVVVGQRGALRQAGGAGGELDVDGIVELQARGEVLEALAIGVSAVVGDFVERKGAGGVAADLDDGP